MNPNYVECRTQLMLLCNVDSKYLSTNRNTQRKTRIEHREMTVKVVWPLIVSEHQKMSYNHCQVLYQSHQSNCQANTCHIPPPILPQQKVNKNRISDITVTYDSHSPSGAAKEMDMKPEKEAHSTPIDTTHMSENNTAYEAVTGMYTSVKTFPLKC